MSTDYKLNDLPIPAMGKRDKWSRYHFMRSELIKIAGWLQEHQFDCEGENITVAQSGASGIGPNTVVRCNKCNDSLDVTEYESW